MAIDEAEFSQRLNTIKGHSSAIIAEADALLLAMEGEPPPEPGPEPEPEPGRNWALDECWGGEIGSNGRKVVEGKVWDGKKISDLDENTDYLSCIHRNYKDHSSDTAMGWGDRIPQRVRFFNLKVQNIDVEYWAYINHGHDEEKNKLWLAIDGLTFTDCKFKAAMELKASIYILKDVTVGSGCSMNQLIRKRHGRQAVIIGGDAKGKECSFRGWCDWCDVPGAVVVGNAGNLPSRSVDWMPLHEAGGGNNMECEEGLYAGPRVKAVKLGYKANNSCTEYECRDSLVHPDAPEPQIVGPEEGWERETLGDYRDLWDLYGLRG
jgi:hypothetical protein